MRPLLLPFLRRLWRNGHTVQLGTDPRLAAVLDLANPATARVLDLLDGTRTERSVVREAAHFGVPAREALALLDALLGTGLVVSRRSLLPAGLPPAVQGRLEREAGALALGQLTVDRPAHRPARTAAEPAGSPAADPAGGPVAGPATVPALDRAARTTGDVAADYWLGPAGRGGRLSPADMMRRRAAAQVLVAGHAWLGAQIAAALAGAGIGHVDPALDGWTRPGDAAVGGLVPTDMHRSRASAAADAVRRAAPETRVAPLRAGDATFVVRVGTRPGSALATRGVRQRAAPRLDVYLRDGVVIVGPLVMPDGSPCGQCLELHRRDRDPAWPALAAQLATGRDSTDACAAATAMAGTAYAVAEVLAHVDGRPVSTSGALVEIAAPGDARRRSWARHPDCHCGRRRRASAIRR
jgi:bacteriocin biosynthesis cyclodehydratase domain-containing protein